MSKNKNLGHNSKKDFLKNPVEHIDITSFDSRKIISSMEKMSFVSRETANAANIYNEMLKDKDCTIFLTLAGSTSAAGCMNIYKDLVKYNMVDAIVATGASIIDMDFFEALGFKHYQGSQFQDDTELRKNYIDRIYDTYIDEDELQVCDKKICEIADNLEPRSYTSREFIHEMGKYLKKNSEKKDSLIETAYDHNVPIFCPAFTDSSAGFGLVIHQEKNPKSHITIDSIREFRELTEIKKSLENLKLSSLPEIICEPGRALVAESGSTIVRVNLRKKQKLYINDGTYGTLFDAGTPNIVFPSKMIKDSSNKIISKKLTAFDFYGPTCDSMDYMKGPFLLPNNIKENDYIELGQLGAYGLTFRTEFNGFFSNEIYEVEDKPIMTLYDKDINKATLVA